MRLFTEGRPGLDNKSAESVAALKSCVEVMDPEIRKVAQLKKYNEETSEFLANEIHKFSQSVIDKVVAIINCELYHHTLFTHSD